MKELRRTLIGSREFDSSFVFFEPRPSIGLCQPSLAFFLRYSNGTFTLTEQFNASASLAFNGTSVWIYGSTGPTQATSFNGTIDGLTYNDTAYSATPLFQQVLFAATGRSIGNHLVTIVDNVHDLAQSYLDVDYVSVRSCSRLFFFLVPLSRLRVG